MASSTEVVAGTARVLGPRASRPRSEESLRRELPQRQLPRYGRGGGKRKMHDLATPDAGPDLIREWIDCTARLHPDKPYIVSVEDGRAITFGEFARLVRRIGSFLERAGIGANDRIALLAGNSIEHVACYVGVMAYGATICTAHVEMNRRHLGGILAQLKPRLALYDDDLVPDSIPDRTLCLRLGRWDAPASGTLFASV